MAKQMFWTTLAACGLAIGASAQSLKGNGAKATPKPSLTPTINIVAAKPAALQTAIPVSRGLLDLTAKSAEVTAAAPALAPLRPLDLSTMWLWNWGGTWIGSEWGNGNSPLPWKFDHVEQPAGVDTMFVLDAGGAPQIQAGTAEAKSSGLWEADVTLPELRDGLIVAPLWLYDPASRDEIDFELAGRRGLDVSMHAYANGTHVQNTVRLFAGTDLSRQRKRFGIKVDQASGAVDMYVDGVRVHRWDRSTTSGFITHPVKPWIEMWAANPWDGGFVGWAGSWTPLAAGQQLTMRVHGYGYSAPLATAATPLSAAKAARAFSL